MDRGVRPIGDWSTPTTLSTRSSPVTRVCRPGIIRAPLIRFASTACRMSLTSVDLPDPDTPVTAISVPSGNFTVRLLQVVLPGADHGQHPVLVDRPADQRNRDLQPAGDVGAGDRLGGRLQVRHRPGDDHLAAVLARTRADVDHPVGGPDGVLVVLDDDQRVAEVAEPGQRLDQPVVVPLVQPDRRLVEHVQHADQAGADLGGQPDPLRLAAGQRRRRPVQRQVLEPDVEQEAEPGGRPP